MSGNFAPISSMNQFPKTGVAVTGKCVEEDPNKAVAFGDERFNSGRVNSVLELSGSVEPPEGQEQVRERVEAYISADALEGNDFYISVLVAGEGGDNSFMNFSLAEISNGLKPGESYLIGRNPNADVLIQDAIVSRKHAKITKIIEGLILEVDSTLPTYLTEVTKELSDKEPSTELIEQVGAEALHEVVELDVDEMGETNEDSEELGEDIRQAVIEVERILVDLEESSRKDKASINNVLEDLQQLSRRYMNAAAEGPWSGNKIRDNHALVRGTQTAVGDAHTLVRKLQLSAETSSSYLNHTGLIMNALEERVLPKTSGTDMEKKSKDVRELVEDTARGIARTSDTTELDLFKRRLSSFDSMVTSGYTETVDDARTELSQLLRKLEEVSEVVNKRNYLAKQGLGQTEMLKK